MTQPDPQHSTTRLGRAMIAVGFVLGIGLLTLWFDSGLERAFNPNRAPAATVSSDGMIEVHLEQNRQGHYVVEGTVNDVRVDFILDTGATDVVIPEQVAREAGLDYGFRSRAMTANGLVDIYATTIGELRLAENILLHDVTASINPAMDDNMVLLGMSALRQVEFTQQGSRLTLRHSSN